MQTGPDHTTLTEPDRVASAADAPMTLARLNLALRDIHLAMRGVGGCFDGEAPFGVELADGRSARALAGLLMQANRCVHAAQMMAFAQICANDLGDMADTVLPELLAVLCPVECLAAVYAAFVNGHSRTLERIDDHFCDYIGDTSTAGLARDLQLAPGSARDPETLAGLALLALRRGDRDDLGAVLGLLPATRASDVGLFVACVCEVLPLAGRAGGLERETAPHLVRGLNVACGLSGLQKWEILRSAAAALDLEYAWRIEEALGDFAIACSAMMQHPYAAWRAVLESELAGGAADETCAALFALLERHVRAE